MNFVHENVKEDPTMQYEYEDQESEGTSRALMALEESIT